MKDPRGRIRLAMLIVAQIAAGCAVLYALDQMTVKSILYLAGLRGPDSDFYFMMGNAIRRGLVIYRDIFDPKPPGMFLLAALSFSLFGSGLLGEILNVLILWITPLLFASWTVRRTKGQARGARIICLQLGLILGLAFTLYNATIGGDWQTEFYGAFCGLLYVTAMDSYVHTARWRSIALACASFAVAILLKEPFLLTLSAAALLLLRRRKDWLMLWVLPFVCACLLYAVVLVALHAPESYVTIYLHGMLGGYILRSGPFWARGLVAWEFIWRDVKEFTGWFPLVIASLITLALPPSRNKRERGLRIALVCVAVGLLLLARSFFPAQFPWHVSTGFCILLLLVSLGGAWLSARTTELSAFLKPLWRTALAVYLTFTAIGLGSDFHGQYFALAIPVYAALFFSLLHHLSTHRPQTQQMLMLGFTLLVSVVLLTSVSFMPPGVAMQTAQIRGAEQQDRATAAAVDRLLDACTVHRYYFLEDRPYAPFTRHVPLNYYLYTRPEHLDRYHPIFVQASFEHLSQAQIIIESRPYVPDPKKGNAVEECIGAGVANFVAQEFTQKPWSCATSYKVPGFIVLFRKHPGEQSMSTAPGVAMGTTECIPRMNEH